MAIAERLRPASTATRATIPGFTETRTAPCGSAAHSASAKIARIEFTLAAEELPIVG